MASTLVAVVAVAGLGFSTAQANQAANTRVARHITVVERAVSDTFIDLEPTGDSRGDILAFANPVYDSSNSRKVGRDQGSCVRTVVGKAFQCSWTTWLAKGSLVVEGPFYDAKDSVLAITGGTGAYSRARGVMHLHARTGTLFAFRFNIQN